jgi:hypothetical protein
LPTNLWAKAKAASKATVKRITCAALAPLSQHYNGMWYTVHFRLELKLQQNSLLASFTGGSSPWARYRDLIVLAAIGMQ